MNSEKIELLKYLQQCFTWRLSLTTCNMLPLLLNRVTRAIPGVEFIITSLGKMSTKSYAQTCGFWAHCPPSDLSRTQLVKRCCHSFVALTGGWIFLNVAFLFKHLDELNKGRLSSFLAGVEGLTMTHFLWCFKYFWIWSRFHFWLKLNFFQHLINLKNSTFGPT